MNFIPVNEPLLDGNEKKYLIECIDTGWISSEGPFIDRFEKETAASVGRRYGVAVSNGTAALEVAIQALRIQPGDEVVMPTFTIISCAAAVVKVGGVPVFVDCDPYTWNMNPDQIESRITARTKAIMLVHIYGLPTDIDPVLQLAKKHGLYVIEDAAEMHGQTYKEKQCGSFGDISIFSFYPNKHITTGEGGMVLTDDPKLAERCASLRNLCFKPERRFVHDEIGSNFRMTNLQAALGVAQLERLDQTVQRKREIGRLYRKLLTDVEGLQLPVERTEYAENIYWVFGVVLQDSIRCSVEEVMEKLKQSGIGTRPFFWPMHEQPVFRKMGIVSDESLPHAELIARRGFYLPSGLTLTNEQIRHVTKVLISILKEERE
ncbi:DegT/DnrJ/EryC1/StrS aminotransferase family protein [Saccharibacillus sp. JS10]|uniref:DegT/DnrJ/EryC1/StrS family aminotransferase n=1 Tax=Saccharibacillus sp. JS10 TaxID=2950552 RepID=UPI002109A1BE|nr:DegT/DnrJ/EryC1/StrS family aminotransferase [Saccharibacillus sp. JS10]MCQ4088803.1 DegT/DnrJ/EryC1/StrS family aminotransferase [Saccharibacillus sp. JS10]